MKSNRTSETSTLLQRMEGVTVALATPLKRDGGLDGKALEQLIQRVIANGAACLFPLGWCGEQPLLSDEVREQVIRRTCRAAGGKVPVMVGVSEQSLSRALRWANLSREAGADMILATPPYSYPIPQEWVLEFFTELSRQSRMPLVVYQNDEVGVAVKDETIGRLSEAPGIVGIKAFMPYHRLQNAIYRYNRPGRFGVMGADEYLYGVGLFLGIRHFTMGGPGNLNMRWCKRMFHHGLAGDWDSVRNEQKGLVEFCDAVYSVGPSPYPVVKYILHRTGIGTDQMSLPLHPLSAGQKKRVDGVLKRFRDILD